jgi:transposase InsO family protein
MQKGQPISFFSKTIGPKAAAMSTYDKEALAILEALKKWEHYFAASSLIIKTDQQSLKYIQEQKIIDGIQHKLLVKLLGYNYTTKHKKGRENRVADALSRVKYHLAAIFSSSVTPHWITQVVQSYSNDATCKDILSQLVLDPNAKRNYKLHNGIIKYKDKILVGNCDKLKQSILSTFHNSELGGHSSERATYQRVKLLFHWRGMKNDTVTFVKHCPTCQLNKSEHVPSLGLLQPLPNPDFAFTHISMDFVEGLPKLENKDITLVVVDRFTKYSHFISMTHPITVQQVAKAFPDNVFKLHGLPTVIVTDRDIIFTSNLWQSLFKNLGVKLHLSTSYHPQTDGQTERLNQCLENYLRCMAFNQPRKWHSWLTMAEWWYNTSFHTSLNMTPFQALYGFPPPMIVELNLPIALDSPDVEQQQQQEVTAEIIKDNLVKAQARMEVYADKHGKEREFEVRDMVYLKIQPYRHTTLSIHRYLKLHSKYYGPFRVLARVGATAYTLLLPEHCKLHPTFHVIQLKKHLGNSVVPSPHLPLVNEHGHIQVAPEAVLERKLIPRAQGDISILVVHWLVKWVNLPLEALLAGKMHPLFRKFFQPSSLEDKSVLSAGELSGTNTI